MKISFLGAAQTVTGSQHLIQLNGYKILLDCGLYQGGGAKAFDVNRHFEFAPEDLNAVILSHSHIDHSGNLPTLFNQGFQGPVYTTHVSMHLTEELLKDSAKIQEGDAEYLNGKLEPGENPVHPLYNEQDVKMANEHLQSQDYDLPFEPVPGVTARLVDAGHILGSASVVLDIEEKGKVTRVWFSGDIGRLDLPIVRDPVLPEDVDILLMESTYGDRIHPPAEQAFDELKVLVKETIERGGKVIIPAFAVGRTQELVYALNQMMQNRDIPEVPVVVDSPLAINVSEIFRTHPQFFDEETLDFIRGGSSALGFDLLTYARTVEESRYLVERDEPMVVIAASGMAENGRILHHLAHGIENPNNTVLIVSWAAPDTLARVLSDGAKQVEILRQKYEVKAKVQRLKGFSAHAGQDFLLAYAQAVKGRVKDVFLVHGEERSAEMLQELLKGDGYEKVWFPYARQGVDF